MKKGPYLIVYDHTNTERLSSIDFGATLAGESSQEICVWLWNRKNFRDAPDATEVRISAIPGSLWAGGIVLSKHISVRSSGVMDPDSVGIVDDMENDFTPVGGDLNDPDNYHMIGDIPANCARRLFFKMDIPEGTILRGVPRMIIQTGYFSSAVKWMYTEESEKTN